MLSSRLSALQQATIRCRIPLILEELSPDDARALTDALKNPNISRRAIVRVLQEEGFTASGDSVNRARKCLSNQIACKCGLQEEKNP